MNSVEAIESINAILSTVFLDSNNTEGYKLLTAVVNEYGGSVQTRNQNSIIVNLHFGPFLIDSTGLVINRVCVKIECEEPTNTPNTQYKAEPIRQQFKINKNKWFNESLHKLYNFLNDLMNSGEKQVNSILDVDKRFTESYFINTKGFITINSKLFTKEHYQLGYKDVIDMVNEYNSYNIGDKIV